MAKCLPASLIDEVNARQMDGMPTPTKGP